MKKANMQDELTFEQIQINRMLPTKVICYHSSEVKSNSKHDNHLLLLDDLEILPVFTMIQYKPDIWECCNKKSLDPKDLHGHRNWKGPYDFCIRMYLRHRDIKKE